VSLTRPTPSPAACLPTGYIATRWALPLLPESCLDVEMNDKTQFFTTIRLSGSWTNFGDSFTDFFQLYGWNQVRLNSGTVALKCSCICTKVLLDSLRLHSGA